MITAIPINSKGEQDGEPKTFTPIQWAKMKSTSKKFFAWREHGESAKQREKELMPVSTKEAKPKKAKDN